MVNTRVEVLTCGRVEFCSQMIASVVNPKRSNNSHFFLHVDIVNKLGRKHLEFIIPVMPHPVRLHTPARFHTSDLARDSRRGNERKTKLLSSNEVPQGPQHMP